MIIKLMTKTAIKPYRKGYFYDLKLLGFHNNNYFLLQNHIVVLDHIK